MANKNLSSAKRAKEDEFYTQRSDIENELMHYKEHFRGKTVLCNCDDPRVSEFFFYFKNNFAHLGLRRLITTCYKSQELDLFSENKSEKAVYLIYDGDKDSVEVKQLQGDGDFRSSECIALLMEADIVVTNPPFSLFREYVAQLMAFHKKFLIIGNKNALSYRDIFQHIMKNEVWVGVTPMSRDLLFNVTEEHAKELLRTGKEGGKYRIVDGKVMGRSPSIWYTNLDTKKRHEELILYKHYTPEEYPHFDNCNAINVGNTNDIPCDYDGIMGVPISFMDKYNPEQFEIVGQMVTTKVDEINFGYPYINGKKKFARILIRRKK